MSTESQWDGFIKKISELFRGSGPSVFFEFENMLKPDERDSVEARIRKQGHIRNMLEMGDRAQILNYLISRNPELLKRIGPIIQKSDPKLWNDISGTQKRPMLQEKEERRHLLPTARQIAEGVDPLKYMEERDPLRQKLKKMMERGERR
jgi:hypothetical protein